MYRKGGAAASDMLLILKPASLISTLMDAGKRILPIIHHKDNVPILENPEVAASGASNAFVLILRVERAPPLTLLTYLK